MGCQTSKLERPRSRNASEIKSNPSLTPTAPSRTQSGEAGSLSYGVSMLPSIHIFTDGIKKHTILDRALKAPDQNIQVKTLMNGFGEQATGEQMKGLEHTTAAKSYSINSVKVISRKKRSEENLLKKVFAGLYDQDSLIESGLHMADISSSVNELSPKRLYFGIQNKGNQESDSPSERRSLKSSNRFVLVESPQKIQPESLITSKKSMSIEKEEEIDGFIEKKDFKFSLIPKVSFEESPQYSPLEKFPNRTKRSASYHSNVNQMTPNSAGKQKSTNNGTGLRRIGSFTGKRMKNLLRLDSDANRDIHPIKLEQSNGSFYVEDELSKSKQRSRNYSVSYSNKSEYLDQIKHFKSKFSRIPGSPHNTMSNKRNQKIDYQPMPLIVADENENSHSIISQQDSINSPLCDCNEERLIAIRPTHTTSSFGRKYFEQVSMKSQNDSGSPQPRQISKFRIRSIGESGNLEYIVKKNEHENTNLHDSSTQKEESHLQNQTARFREMMTQRTSNFQMPDLAASNITIEETNIVGAPSHNEDKSHFKSVGLQQEVLSSENSISIPLEKREVKTPLAKLEGANMHEKLQ